MIDYVKQARRDMRENAKLWRRLKAFNSPECDHAAKMALEEAKIFRAISKAAPSFQ